MVPSTHALWQMIHRGILVLSKLVAIIISFGGKFYSITMCCGMRHFLWSVLNYSVFSSVDDPRYYERVGEGERSLPAHFLPIHNHALIMLTFTISLSL